MGGKYATECHRSNANFYSNGSLKTEVLRVLHRKKHQKSMLYIRKDGIPS